MRIRHRWPAIIIGVIFLITLGIGAAAVFAQTSGDAEGRVGTDDGSEETIQVPPSDRTGFWRSWGRGPDQLHQGPIARLRRSGIDRDQLLADALDISLEELGEARAEAQEAWILQAVEEEVITQDEADLLLAVAAFKNTVDKVELLASALGINLEELEQAREDGLLLRELLEELDLNPADVREDLRAVFESAVEDALFSGAITQEQAELILEFERPGRFLRRIHPFGSWHPGRPGDF
jgi:hypothetical protein